MSKSFKDMTIQSLVEIQDKNKFDDTKMGALIGVSAESYRRWKKRICFPNQTIVLARIANVLEEYHKAS